MHIKKERSPQTEHYGTEEYKNQHGILRSNDWVRGK